MSQPSLLNAITKEAVDRAIAEHDRIGSEAFLDKYGFHPARDYRIRLGANEYPSKAIMGAARAFVGDGFPALKPSDFSGGRSTVVKRLRALGFDIPEAPRNDLWRWDELVLALDLYFRSKQLSASALKAECESLSGVLGRMGTAVGATKTATYRNWNGVHLKLMNFRRLDPEYQAQGKLGMRRGAKAEEAVWARFSRDRLGLHAEAQRILAACQLLSSLPNEQQPTIADPYEAEEGGVQLRVHKHYERDRRLVERKKAEAAKYGPLVCEACGFDFRARYGTIALGFIEVHHKKPVHLLAPGEKTRLSDLALLCSNCHRVAHIRNPPLSVSEIQAALVAAGN